MASPKEKFDLWFLDQQLLAERCGHSLGQYHMDLMESAWEAALLSATVDLSGVKAEADKFCEPGVDSIYTAAKNAIEQAGLTVKSNGH